ncbi:hypothetical protein H4Q26_015578 [Puccinia striiformis f. sp. tritici PST-130]|nr:hypothetical protein H4Q26_015578 [Puccinia striiformis f. sp. tritici PST-130]
MSYNTGGVTTTTYAFFTQRKGSLSPSILTTQFQSVIQLLDIPINMLRFFRLAALVLLMTSWEVAGDTYDPKTKTTYFGCHKNVDAVCSEPDRLTQTLTWAVRLHRGKRDYACRYGTHPHCCDQGVYQSIDYDPAIVLSGPVPSCTGGGQ